MVDSKKTNLNKKKLNFIKFKKGQSPYEIYSYVQSLIKFLEYKDSIQFALIDDLLTDCNLDTDLHVIMETNEALENIYDIAHSSKRIVALYFGGVDMAAELRVPNNYQNLIYARSKLVHAGASAGIDVIDVPYLDLEDMNGMKKEAELVRNLGFTGKGSIHPKQINILNEVFTPSKGEITKAKKIIDQFNASDTGLVVIDGKLIEKPVLREMQRQILVADKINQ